MMRRVVILNDTSSWRCSGNKIRYFRQLSGESEGCSGFIA